MSARRIFVTRATGPIGRGVVRELVSRGPSFKWNDRTDAVCKPRRPHHDKPMTSARVIAVGLLFAPAMTSPALGKPSSAPADDGFARGIVALTRSGMIHDPQIVGRSLGIVLRNPGKWSEQPEGTFRTARWHDPPNRHGVKDLELSEASNGEISTWLKIQLRGTPCITLLQVERAAGARATHGGMVSSVAYDGPPQAPQYLGREHGFVTIRMRNGRSTSIDTVARSSQRGACLKSVSVQVERPSPLR